MSPLERRLSALEARLAGRTAGEREDDSLWLGLLPEADRAALASPGVLNNLTAEEARGLLKRTYRAIHDADPQSPAMTEAECLASTERLEAKLNERRMAIGAKGPGVAHALPR